jgi:hypothetical protein
VKKCEALPQRGLEIVIFIGINHGRIHISQKSIEVRKTSEPQSCQTYDSSFSKHVWLDDMERSHLATIRASKLRAEHWVDPAIQCHDSSITL